VGVVVCGGGGGVRAAAEDQAASTARTSCSEVEQKSLRGIDHAPMNTPTERNLVRGLGNQDLLIQQLHGPELENAPSGLLRDRKKSSHPSDPSQVPFLLRFPVVVLVRAGKEHGSCFSLCWLDMHQVTFYGVVIGSTSQSIVWLNISRSPVFWGGLEWGCKWHSVDCVGIRPGDARHDLNHLHSEGFLLVGRCAARAASSFQDSLFLRASAWNY